MSDLIEFLKARLDEDEQLAKAAAEKQGGFDWEITEVPYEGICVWSEPDAPGGTSAITEHIAHHDPARVLREVAAKRKLIGYHEGGQCGFSDNGECLHCDLLGILASVYSDHPDYPTVDEEKP